MCAVVCARRVVPRTAPHGRCRITPVHRSALCARGGLSQRGMSSHSHTHQPAPHRARRARGGLTRHHPQQRRTAASPAMTSRQVTEQHATTLGGCIPRTPTRLAHNNNHIYKNTGGAQPLRRALIAHTPLELDMARPCNANMRSWAHALTSRINTTRAIIKTPPPRRVVLHS